MNLHDDLTARWKPSDEQIAEADAAFAAHPSLKYVISGHFLAGKEYGIWTSDVELLYPSGDDIVFVFDDAAYRAAQEVAEVAAVKAAGERPGTVGYTVHRREGWAVFEEILSPAKILHFAGTAA